MSTPRPLVLWAPGGAAIAGTSRPANVRALTAEIVDGEDLVARERDSDGRSSQICLDVPRALLESDPHVDLLLIGTRQPADAFAHENDTARLCHLLADAARRGHFTKDPVDADVVTVSSGMNIAALVEELSRSVTLRRAFRDPREIRIVFGAGAAPLQLSLSLAAAVIYDGVVSQIEIREDRAEQTTVVHPLPAAWSATGDVTGPLGRLGAALDRADDPELQRVLLRLMQGVAANGRSSVSPLIDAAVDEFERTGRVPAQDQLVPGPTPWARSSAVIVFGEQPDLDRAAERLLATAADLVVVFVIGTRQDPQDERDTADGAAALAAQIARTGRQAEVIELQDVNPADRSAVLEALTIAFSSRIAPTDHVDVLQHGGPPALVHGAIVAALRSGARVSYTRTQPGTEEIPPPIALDRLAADAQVAAGARAIAGSLTLHGRWSAIHDLAVALGAPMAAMLADVAAEVVAGRAPSQLPRGLTEIAAMLREPDIVSVAVCIRWLVHEQLLADGDEQGAASELDAVSRLLGADRLPPAQLLGLLASEYMEIARGLLRSLTAGVADDLVEALR